MTKTKYSAILAMLLCGQVSAECLGPENVVDGGFSSGGTFWTLGYSWQAIPGLAFHNEGYTAPIEQPSIVLTAGKTYRASYTVSGSYTSTDPRTWIRLRGTTANANCPINTGDGIHTCDLIAPVGVYSVQVRNTSGFAGVLDDVSVREVLP